MPRPGWGRCGGFGRKTWGRLRSSSRRCGSRGWWATESVDYTAHASNFGIDLMRYRFGGAPITGHLGPPRSADGVVVEHGNRPGRSAAALLSISHSDIAASICHRLVLVTRKARIPAPEPRTRPTNRITFCPEPRRVAKIATAARE